jgi:hypothetical protein
MASTKKPPDLEASEPSAPAAGPPAVGERFIRLRLPGKFSSREQPIAAPISAARTAQPLSGST